MVIVLDLNALRKRILPELATRYFGGLESLDYRVAVIAKGAKPEVIYSSDPGFGTHDLETLDASLNIFGPPDRATGNQIQQARNARSLRSAEWHNLYGAAWFPVIEYESHPVPWVLGIQRRDGPLQSVIRRVRERNLAVSAFVLVLLALSMAFLTMAGLRAQKFSKLQMDFVASVSHELRTPLTAIFSAGENIKDGVVHDKTDLSDYGSIVMGQSRHLMDYVDRILLFASINSGKDRYSIRPLQVAEILRQVRRDMEIVIIEESRVIEEFIEPDLPCVVGDLRAVCGCLENLMTNAIKYSGSDQRIRVSARAQTVESGKQVAISIQDRGIGIHSSDLKRIFEPFYRTPQATMAQIPGTGLGLSVSKHLAEAMGGSLTVVSEVGVGSTFTLHLLTADSPQAELMTVNSANGQGDRG
jgi:signal transduction histidine kinase